MGSNVNDLSPNSLVNVLVEGRDLTRELQLGLGNETHSSSNKAYGLMAKDILAKFERSLQILQYDPMNQFQFQLTTTATNDSPNFFSGSPKSLDSDGEFRDPAEYKDDSKKRRVSPRITQRVQGSTSSGLEGPIEDGYNWRKYGQKDILGANFPRAYYRCTHRVFQGCLATKQVQRSDDDPSFFDVTYRGKHTCSQAASSSSSSSHLQNPTPKSEPIETLIYTPHQHPHTQQQPQKIIWDFKRDNNNVEDIKPIITTHNNNIINLKNKCPSFSFPSSSNPLLHHGTNNNFVGQGNFPTNSSTYTTYQSSQSLLLNHNFNDHNNQNNIDVDHPLQGALIQQNGVYPSSTSAANSPTIASELSFDNQGEFDDVFNLENPNYY
ncbi:probable WRKY transcription factor 53 [Chenopodium quinoa]|uniref:probable WRKY transcription factor 53 n=1 Tax=Chenopodium quinoa TaxID=63459 RepID=UPI000B785338|nr:probable WRKY transcription factor 53 [Chenopodium quinoa]